ncbi:hypothetical protein, partial [Escherichia albertii]
NYIAINSPKIFLQPPLFIST